MHTKSDDIEIIIGNDIAEIIEELFDSLLQKHQKGLLESMNGSEFYFESVSVMHYKYHKISLSCSGSYIHSSKWLKNKKPTINSKNNDNKCFQRAIKICYNYCKRFAKNIKHFHHIKLTAKSFNELINQLL